MLDYIVINQDGDPVVNLADLTRDPAAAIGDVTVKRFKPYNDEDKGYVEQVRFKLADKRGALVDLGRHFGLFTDKHVVDATHSLEKLADDELLARCSTAEETR